MQRSHFSDMRAPAILFHVLAVLLLVAPHSTLGDRATPAPVCSEQVHGSLPANWDTEAWQEVVEVVCMMDAEATGELNISHDTIYGFLRNVQTLLRLLTTQGRNATVGDDNQYMIQYLRRAFTQGLAYLRRHFPDQESIGALKCSADGNSHHHRHLLRDVTPEGFYDTVTRREECIGVNTLTNKERVHACVTCVRTEAGCPCACYDALYELKWYNDDAVVLAIVNHTYDFDQLFAVYYNLQAKSCEH